MYTVAKLISPVDEQKAMKPSRSDKLNRLMDHSVAKIDRKELDHLENKFLVNTAGCRIADHAWNSSAAMQQLETVSDSPNSFSVFR